MLLLMFAVQGGGGGGGYAANLDLTTVFVLHEAALRTANPGKDLTTLIANDIPTVRTAVSGGNKDDVNTAYSEYLLTHN